MKIHFEAENETVTIQIKRKESSTAEDDVDKYELENNAIDVLKKLDGCDHQGSTNIYSALKEILGDDVEPEKAEYFELRHCSKCGAINLNGGSRDWNQPTIWGLTRWL